MPDWLWLWMDTRAPDGISLNEWYMQKSAAARRGEAPAPTADSSATEPPAVQLRWLPGELGASSSQGPLMPVFRPSIDVSGPDGPPRQGFVSRLTTMVSSAAEAAAPTSSAASAGGAGGAGVRALLEQPSALLSEGGFNASTELRSRPDVIGFSKAQPIPSAMREAFMEAKRRVAKMKEEGKPLAPGAMLSALGAYLVVPPGARTDKIKKPSADRKVAGASERLYPGPKVEVEEEEAPQEPVLRVRGASERLYPGPKAKASEGGDADEEGSPRAGAERPERVLRVKGASERLYPGPRANADPNSGALMDSPEPAPAPPVRRVIGASSRLYPGGGRRGRRDGSSSDSSSDTEGEGGDEAPARSPRAHSGLTGATGARGRQSEAPAAVRARMEATAPARPQRSVSVRARVGREEIPGSPRVVAGATAPVTDPAAVESLEPLSVGPGDALLDQPLSSVGRTTVSKPKLVGKSGAYINGKFVLFDPVAEAKKKPSLAVCLRNLKKRVPGIDLKAGGKCGGHHWMYRSCPGICAPAGGGGSAVAGFMAPDNSDSAFIPALDWTKENSSSHDGMALGVKYLEWLEKYTHHPVEHTVVEWDAELAAALARCMPPAEDPDPPPVVPPPPCDLPNQSVDDVPPSYVEP